MANRKKRPAQPRGSSKSERNKFQAASPETLTTGGKYRKKSYHHGRYVIITIISYKRHKISFFFFQIYFYSASVFILLSFGNGKMITYRL